MCAMLAAAEHPVASMALSTKDSRTGKRKRFAPADAQHLSSKRLKVVYTATVPTKRCESGVIVVKACKDNALTAWRRESRDSDKQRQTVDLRCHTDDEDEEGYCNKDVTKAASFRVDPQPTRNNASSNGDAKPTRRSEAVDVAADKHATKTVSEEPKSNSIEGCELSGVQLGSSAGQHGAQNLPLESHNDDSDDIHEKNDSSQRRFRLKQQPSADTIQKKVEAMENGDAGSDVVSFENNGDERAKAINRGGETQEVKTKHCDSVDLTEAQCATGPRNDNIGTKPAQTIEVGSPPYAFSISGLLPSSKTESSKYVDNERESSSLTEREGGCERRTRPVNVKTIKPCDLVKFLHRYNLTLKAVPIDSKLVEGVKEKSLKLQTMIVSPQANRGLKGCSDKQRPGKYRASMPVNSNAMKRTKLLGHQERDVFNAFLKTTSSSTSSNWKIDKSRVAKSCYDAGSADARNTYQRTKATDSAGRKSKRRMGRFNVVQVHTRGSGLKNNRSECSDASCSQNPLQMIPLSTAFHDLEARDKAARETLETARTLQIEPGVEASAEKDLCSLSSTMQNLVSNTLTDSTRLSGDPVLTSVAFDEASRHFEDSVDTLVLNRISLPRSESLDNRCAKNCGRFAARRKLAEEIKIPKFGNPAERRDYIRNFVTDDATPVGGGDSENVGPFGSFNIKAGDLDRPFASEPSLRKSHRDSGGLGENSRAEIIAGVVCAKRDLRRRNISSASCDCATDESVTADDEGPSSRESTQMETRDFEHRLEKFDNSWKPVETCNSEKRPDQLSSATERKEMHKTGYCSVTCHPTVPVTSAEQLEESVNFDDLLGSGNILSSLELTDVLDSQEGSYLKSLGTDSEHRSMAQYSYGTPGPLSGVYNHFSPASIPSYHGAARFSHRHCDEYAPSSTQVEEYYSHTNFGNSAIAEHTNGNFVSPPPQSNAHEFSNMAGDRAADTSRPWSPSAYYNLPASETLANGACPTGCNEQYHQTNPVTKPTFPWAKTAVLNSSTIACSRDSAVSDTDSGIHSPDSTPNKYAVANGICYRETKSLSQYRQDSANEEAYSRGSCANRGTAWMEQNGNGVSMQVFTMPFILKTENAEDGFIDSNDQETWERASTSSTTSTLSVESETKLLNMDDCKTYVSQTSSPCATTSRSPNDCHFFASTSESVANGIDPSAIARVGQGDCKGSKFVTQGNITTVFPAFVTHVPHSTLQSEGGLHRNEAGGDQDKPPKPLDPESKGNRYQNKRPAKFGGNSGLVGRGYACDGQEGFIESFDIKMRRTPGKSVHLWEFIRDTLLNPEFCPRIIKWEDRKAGIFRFVQSDVVAGMWGEKKNNPKMTYEKLSRAMRYYYNRGILERVDGRRLVYKFGKNAHGWQYCGESGDAKPSDSGKAEVRKEYLNRSTSEPVPHCPAKSVSPRKTGSCRIAVTMTDDILPSVKKRRRESTEVPNYVSVITDQQKSAGTQTPPGLNENVTEPQTCENAAEVTCDQTHGTQIVDTPISSSQLESCIVYVARPERLSSDVMDDTVVNVFESEEETHTSDKCMASPERKGKLPSADVLLGKQYRIATAAI